MSTYDYPRPDRQRVIRRIVRLCANTPRSSHELARIIGTSIGCIYVLTHRMRRYGQIETLSPGTRHARHLAVRGGSHG